MKGVVWGSTFANASEKLTEIVDRYIKAGYEIENQVHSKNTHCVLFTNGDTWRAVRASDNARGNRCNISYIERDIDYNVYRTVVEPSTTLLPFTAIRFYGEGNLHITDKITELPFA